MANMDKIETKIEEEIMNGHSDTRALSIDIIWEEAANVMV